jgi:prepilin peptidase CpaA
MIIKLVFIAILLGNAASDLAAYRIPNWAVIALIALFAIVAAAHYRQVAWTEQIAASLLCFIGGLIFYRLGQMGAGDVKLIAAIALWSGMWALMPVLLYTAIAGLGVMLLIVGARYGIKFAKHSGWMEREVPRVLRLGEGIPYGVAIALAAIAAVPSFPAWLWT